VTFSNVECTDAGTNKQLTASASGFTLISSSFNVGGVALRQPAARSRGHVGRTYTTLTGPAYYQATNTDISTGTIILNAPAGFIFDALAPRPNVLITRLAGPAAIISTTPPAAVRRRSLATTNQITFTVKRRQQRGCYLLADLAKRARAPSPARRWPAAT